ncbi:MAG: peptidoglycan DD-metalloendopeptidase family protein [Bacteroidetes bacterium]|nr:peptidoglycan DD-metalloendopeptidase family protein [Bacteroidota bacterium]
MTLLKYENHNNKWLLWLFVLIFIFSNNNFAQLKNKQKELEQKKKRIHEEIDNINDLLNETRLNKKSSIGTLLNIKVKLEKRQELINTIKAQINELNNQIQINEKQLLALKNNLDKLKADYSKMIVFASRNQDNYSKLMFVFAAQGFNQAYARLKYIQQYNQFRRKQANEIVTTQNSIGLKVEELKNQKHEKNLLLGGEQEEKQNLDNERKEQEGVIEQLQAKEKTLKHDLEKKKKEIIELQSAIKKLIAEEIKRRAEEAEKKAKEETLAKEKARKEEEKKNKKENHKNNQDKEKPAIADVKPDKKDNYFTPDVSESTEALSDEFINNRGKLPWPIVKGVICAPYGEYEHPAIKGFMMVNNGIDICAPKGSTVRAVFAGEVTGISVAPTGGKLIIIRHGEYYSVYSNLGDVQVKTGQKIAVKQPIGTALYNDDDGKTNINFQIWKGQKTLDPAAWLFGAR